LARSPPGFEGVERPPRSWPPPPRSRPPPMPRWRPGVVGGPFPLRTLPSARLARFSRPSCVFDVSDAGSSSLLGLSLCRAEKPAQDAAAVFRSTRGFCISAIKARVAPLCAFDFRALRCAFAASCCLAAPAPPAPVFGCGGRPLRRQDPELPLPPTPLPFARSLRQLAPQAQQPPPQQQPSELLSALRGGASRAAMASNCFRAATCLFTFRAIDFLKSRPAFSSALRTPWPARTSRTASQTLGLVLGGIGLQPLQSPNALGAIRGHCQMEN
jgi:hypothetical protein